MNKKIEAVIGTLLHEANRPDDGKIVKAAIAASDLIEELLALNTELILSATEVALVLEDGTFHARVLRAAIKKAQP